MGGDRSCVPPSDKPPAVTHRHVPPYLCDSAVHSLSGRGAPVAGASPDQQLAAAGTELVLLEAGIAAKESVLTLNALLDRPLVTRLRGSRHAWKSQRQCKAHALAARSKPKQAAVTHSVGLGAVGQHSQGGGLHLRTGWGRQK